MKSSIFSKLKKYAGTEISQDENYATETLAALLHELPNYKQYLINNLFHILISANASVKTQEQYQTNHFGRAILDLVMEDEENFIMIEVKIGAGINIYESQDKEDDELYDQIQKYEDCIGLPENKNIYIFTLTQHVPEIGEKKYHYYNTDSDNISWHELYRSTREYYIGIKDTTPEKYLLEHFIQFLKEDNMAGFQGFTIQNLADVSRLVELANILKHHREVIKTRIKIDGFKGKEENLAYARDGIFYRCSGNDRVGVFMGLWYSDEIYHFKFPQESGPHAMVFLEIPPQNPIRKHILESDAFKKAGSIFSQKNVGFQVLLRSKPLTDFLGAEDQVGALLSFYQESVDELKQSGIIDLILSYDLKS